MKNQDSVQAFGQSWGRYPQVGKQKLYRASSISSAKTIFEGGAKNILPRGLGRSYGDSCLNEGGSLLCYSSVDNIISFDRDTGVLVAEAGISLEQILKVIIPGGYFLPVTPGTKFVTLGGAIANDVHGKNHHVAGTFGSHVIWFDLLRTDGKVLRCDSAENSEYFKSTIGGLGLTGCILRAAIQLKPICSSKIDQQTIRFRCLEEFFEVSADSAEGYEYSVAWVDALATGRSLGRGLFMRGNHSQKEENLKSLRTVPMPLLRIPIDAPDFSLNTITMRLFNFFYYNKQLKRLKNAQIHYNSFFYPLDAFSDWNRLYGKSGFVQFQCVVPRDTYGRNIREVLEIAARSGRASFLAVLKEFGDRPSPGMLSFPRQGTTLCLDFPFEGAATRSLLSRLEELVIDLGGALYPAKDALMSQKSFLESFPGYERFSQYRDPGISSSMMRRLGFDADCMESSV